MLSSSPLQDLCLGYLNLEIHRPQPKLNLRILCFDECTLSRVYQGWLVEFSECTYIYVVYKESQIKINKKRSSFYTVRLYAAIMITSLYANIEPTLRKFKASSGMIVNIILKTLTYRMTCVNKVSCIDYLNYELLLFISTICSYIHIFY